MDIYVVLSVYPQLSHNDYETIHYYEDLNVISIHRNFEDAVKSARENVQYPAPVLEKELNTDQLCLGHGWEVGTHSCFIVKRQLD